MTSAEARIVAFMDIGTNSIRLLLVRIHPDYSYTILTQLKQIARLGDGAVTHEHLQPDAINCGHAGLVQDARLCVVDTQHVALHIDAAHDCQVEVWGVQKHLAVFEKVFGRQLVIKVRQQTSAHGVSAMRGMLVQPYSTVAACSGARS